MGSLLIIAVYVFIVYYFFVSPTSFRWKGVFGERRVHSEFSIHGIDISHYQGEIDWDLLRNAQIEEMPLRFVIIKATEGSNLIDPYFNDNFYQARENNLIRGAYHFFNPSQPAEEQARHFMRQVHLEEGDLPPVLDFEQKGQLSAGEIGKAALMWLKMVGERYGVNPIIYTNYDFKKRFMPDSLFGDYPYWIAHYYVDTLKYRGPWKLWQHTDRGRINGIKGFVDFNIYNGSMYDLQKLTIGHQDEEDSEEKS